MLEYYISWSIFASGIIGTLLASISSMKKSHKYELDKADWVNRNLLDIINRQYRR